jgi:hypothetical protein
MAITQRVRRSARWPPRRPARFAHRITSMAVSV